MIKINTIIRTFFIATFLFFAVLNINLAFAASLNLSSESADYEPKELKSLGVFDIDKGVPDSPAFAVLNLTPSKILTPNSPREFATSILNAQDENGNFKQGIAIDTSFLNLFGREVTLDKYRYKYEENKIFTAPNAIFYRTRLSFATVKGQEDADESMKLSLGVHFLPIDSGDVRLNKNIDKCYDNAANLTEAKYPIKSARDFNMDMKLHKKHRKEMLEKRATELRKSLKGKSTVSNIKGCVDEELKDKKINRWAIGIAPKLISPDGDSDNFQYDGFGVWTSYAYGMDRLTDKFHKYNALKSDGSTQVIIHARYLFDESNPVPGMPNNFLEQDSFFVGGKLQTAGNSWNAALEFSYNIAYPDVGETDESFLYAFVFEKKILKDLWIEASVGSTDGRDLQDDNAFGKVNLKWAFTEMQRALFMGNDK